MSSSVEVAERAMSGGVPAVAVKMSCAEVVKDVAEATPRVGVVSTGDVEKTRLVEVVPVVPAAERPVMLLKHVMEAEPQLVPPLATGNMPATSAVARSTAFVVEPEPMKMEDVSVSEIWESVRALQPEIMFEVLEHNIVVLFVVPRAPTVIVPAVVMLPEESTKNLPLLTSSNPPGVVSPSIPTFPDASTTSAVLSVKVPSSFTLNARPEPAVVTLRAVPELPESEVLI